MPALTHETSRHDSENQSSAASKPAPSSERSALVLAVLAAAGWGLYLLAHFFGWSGNLPPPTVGVAWAVPLLILMPLLTLRGGRLALAAGVVGMVFLLLVVVPAAVFELFVRPDYYCIPELCAGAPGLGWYLGLLGTLLGSLAGFARWRAVGGWPLGPRTSPA